MVALLVGVVAALHGRHHLLQGVPSGGRGGACSPDGVAPPWPRSCVVLCARCLLPKGPDVRAAPGALLGVVAAPSRLDVVAADP